MIFCFVCFIGMYVFEVLFGVICIDVEYICFWLWVFVSCIVVVEL